ncbi:MAG: S8 family serine peptidase [Geobacter sp.]|nr:S8 family serine peptidase [Geobacter sp.]
MRRLFGKEAVSGTAPKRIDRGYAEARHRQQRDSFKAKVAAIREKRLQKKMQQGKSVTTEKEVPYLGSVYRVEVDPEADIDEACRHYAQDPNVAYCQPDYPMQAQWIPNDPFYSSSGSWAQGYDDLWGLKKLQTSAAWDITRGSGVVVAVVDTGVDYTHPDLAANLWSNGGEIAGNGLDDDNNGFVDDVRGWDFASTDNDPMDGHGHGTHVSGTIAAVGDNAEGIVGVAPSARIMPVKGLSDSGSGKSSWLANAIKYATDNGADVINNSWGCGSPCPSNPVAEDAVRYAHDLGAVVVFAAGNSQSDVQQISPQNRSNDVITVAASSELDTRSYFSNFGSLIDVAAPGGGDDGTSTNRAGRNILSLRAGSTDMYGDGLCLVGDKYFRARGTSMAAPHVSGVAALVVAKHPEFTPDDVSQVLRASADDIESVDFDLFSGAGRVNAQKAVNVNVVPHVKITSPTGPVNVATNTTVTVTGDANGPNFASYRLYYATLDKTLAQVGAWQALGPESAQMVTGGVLATIDSSLFEPNRYYLVKLEVVTTDNTRFTDVKEFMLYKDDSSFYKLTGSIPPVFVDNPVSAGDRFAWTEVTIADGNLLPQLVKLYDGATNRLLTISPVEGQPGAWIDKIFLTPNKIVWYETNYSYGSTVVASLSPTDGIVVERKLPYQLFSVDKDNILLNQGRNPYYGALVYVYNIKTDTLSQEYPLPQGDYSAGWPSISGNSVVTHMWYPAPLNYPYETLNLTNLTTGENEVVRLLNRVVDYGHPFGTAVNSPGFVVWNETDSVANNSLMLFDKTTKEIRTVAEDFPGSSFATDGSTVLYSRMGTESGYLKNNLYAYDIRTGTTSLYAMNYVPGADEFGASLGTSHVQWVRGGIGANFYNIMVSNDVPSLATVSRQAVAPNTQLIMPVSASDPEGDKVDISAVGGTWPDSSAELPAGATFTDNGDGTGELRWTPTTVGSYTVSFLARDFTGRKDGAWNTARTVTIQVTPDVTPPTSTINGTSASPTNATAATLTVGGTNVVAYIYKLDTGVYSAEISVETPIILTGLADGVHIVSVLGRDSIGSWQTTPTTVSWSVDTTPPTSAISGTPASPTSATGATLTVGGADVVGYMYRVDSGTYSAEMPVDTPIVLNGLAEGVRTVSVLGRDSVGNWQTAATTVSWSVDTTPPTSAISGTPESPTNATGATLTVSGAEVVAYMYRLDSGAYSAEIPVDTSIVLTGLAEGVHTVSVLGRDSAGNWQTAPTTVSWSVDMTPPTSAISGTPANPTNATGATLTVSAADVVAYMYRVDSGAYSAEIAVDTPIILTGLAEGAHTVSVLGRDSVGNWQITPTTVSWSVDTTPPTSAISGTPASPTNATGATLSVSGVDVVAYMYRLDSGAYSTEIAVDTPIILTGLAEGVQTVFVLGRDSVGNWQTAPTTVSWSVDMTPPTSAISGTPASPTNATGATLAVSGAEVVAYMYRLDSGAYSAEIPVDTSIVLTGLAEGVHTVSVLGRDSAGNWQTAPTTASWSVDTVPPTSAISGTPANPTIATSATLTVGGADVIAYMYRVDSGAYSTERAVDTPIILTGLADGVHIVSVIGRDSAGNWQITPTTVSWSVDTTPPTSAISGTPASPTNATGATFTVSGADVVAYMYRVDSGAYSTEIAVDTPIILTGLAEGVHTVSVLGRDIVGNWQITPATVSWSVDTTPPTSAISGTPASPTNATGATLTVGGADVVAYMYKVDTGAYSTEIAVATPIILSGLAEGGHTVSVLGKDSAGNWQITPASVSWTVDVTPPALAVTSPKGTSVTTNKTTYTVKGTMEPGATVVVTTDTAASDGPATVTTSSTWSYLITGLVKGTNTVTVTATDAAGNASRKTFSILLR